MIRIAKRFALQWGNLIAMLACAVAIPGPTAAASDIERGEAVHLQYAPRCSDPVCEAWRDFRVARPFPVQTIAARHLQDRLVLVFSEPTLAPAELGPLLRRAFGSDVLALNSYRWRIGVDGWLADAVLTLRWPSTRDVGETLNDPGLRDRLAVVAQRLWGTSVGLDLEPIDRDLAGRARAAAPNLEPRALELAQWLREPRRNWMRIDRPEPIALAVPTTGITEGAFTSTDGALSLLALPPEVFEEARLDPQKFAQRWRASFRTFALASDAVLGAAWSRSGPLLLVARARRIATDVMRPLRFETFAVLIRTHASELAQSYERRTPLAGRIRTGSFANADWAPIYLSEALLDGELGALLNITDQMLKSWSAAGNIEYQYFDYPLRPPQGAFVFGAEPISEIVRRESGATGVLYNWNTRGAANIVDMGSLEVIAAARTGSLPITYGAELVRGEGMVVGRLRTLQAHENTAYSYFSELRDPNLARVVSYTTLYQAMDAFKTARNLRSAQEEAQAESPRSAAMQALADELAPVLGDLGASDAQARLTARLLREALEAARADGADFDEAARAQLEVWAGRFVATRLSDLSSRLQQIRAQHPAYADVRVLARRLVDRAEGAKLGRELMLRQERHNAEIERFNQAVRAGTLTAEAVRPWRERLDREQSALGRAFQARRETQSAIIRLGERLYDFLSEGFHLERARARFVRAASAEPAGWIRTPSIVVSWNANDINRIGGHNLDAQALRIVVDPAIVEPRLERASGGRLLRVPPAQAATARANATLLARRIEHESLDANAVRTLLGSTPELPVRTVASALQTGTDLPAAHQASRFAGHHSLDDAALRQSMLAQHELLGRPALLATRDADGYFILATRTGQQVHCCVRVLDFASLRDRVLASRPQGDVMLVNFHERQAFALRRNLQGQDDEVLLEAVASAGGGGAKPPSDVVYALRAGEPSGPGGAGRRGQGDDNPPGKPPTPPQPPMNSEPEPGGAYLAGVVGQRGDPLAALQASQRPRQFEAVQARIEGEAAREEIASLQGKMRNRGGNQALEDLPGVKGEPVVFRLRWRDAARPTEGDDTRIIAGVDRNRVAIGTEVVETAINTAGSERISQSHAQFFARVKELVAKHRERRSVLALLEWVEENDVSYLLSQLGTRPR